MNRSHFKLISAYSGILAILGFSLLYAWPTFNSSGRRWVAFPIEDVEESPNYPIKISGSKLPNLIRVHEKVYSGGVPDSPEAFLELRYLKIRTIISVDGTKPNTALANTYKMQYVHLPHGYNGISDKRVMELAKAILVLDGPIYIHCHHGKHRSPTAAAAACVTAGLIDTAIAKSVLSMAGTDEKYKGLFQTVDLARHVSESTLSNYEVEFPEVAEVPEIAEAMSGLDQYFDHLVEFTKSDWKDVASLNGLDPTYEALMLRESLDNLTRSEATTNRPKEFKDMLEQSVAECIKFEEALRAWRENAPDESVPSSVTRSFDRVKANCQSCHQKYRDNSLFGAPSKAP